MSKPNEPAARQGEGHKTLHTQQVNQMEVIDMEVYVIGPICPLTGRPEWEYWEVIE
tara:strand:+ start:272 stop:439 length:168 start_codon:yes stop_codon:yes gene_type:complete